MSVFVATLIMAGVFACAGVLAIVASVASWDWFFNSPNVRILTGRLSRGKARVVYFVIGLAIIAKSAFFVYKAWAIA